MLDEAVLGETTGGDPEFAASLLADFVETSRGDLEALGDAIAALGDAIAARDHAGAGTQAHPDQGRGPDRRRQRAGGLRDPDRDRCRRRHRDWDTLAALHENLDQLLARIAAEVPSSRRLRFACVGVAARCVRRTRRMDTWLRRLTFLGLIAAQRAGTGERPRAGAAFVVFGSSGLGSLDLAAITPAQGFHSGIGQGDVGRDGGPANGRAQGGLVEGRPHRRRAVPDEGRRQVVQVLAQAGRPLTATLAITATAPGTAGATRTLKLAFTRR